jgi:hypothetical protein
MGGNAFGFLVVGVGWPLSHILILILINAGISRAAPYGGNCSPPTESNFSINANMLPEAHSSPKF